jgi:hypothetical protein
MKAETRIFRDALASLCAATGSDDTRPLFEVLVRAAVSSPAAAALLCNTDLRTKQQRREAILAAAVAISAERDERRAAG